MRPKVVHLVVTGSVGGAEIALVTIASRPEMSDAEHCIALFTDNPRVRALFVDAGLSVHDRGNASGGPIAYLRRSFGRHDLAWLANVLRRENATCVNAHTFATHMLAARVGLECNLPVVRSEADYMHYTNPTCSLYRRWALRNTTMLIANSHYVSRYVAEFEPRVADRIRVIHRGIDLSRFKATPPPSDRPFTFAMAARLVAIKQVHIAIDAIAQTKGTCLNIVGDGPELENLKRHAHARGMDSRVVFHGFQADPRPILSNSHAILSCSRFDAFPRNIVEAAALGRPAVAFSVGGVSEMVRDGETGWLTHDSTVQALASAISEAASNPEEAARRGANARALVESEYSIERTCLEYGKVYAEFARRRDANEPRKAAAFPG